MKGATMCQENIRPYPYYHIFYVFNTQCFLPASSAESNLLKGKLT